MVKLKGKLQLGLNFISIKRVKNKYKQNNANLMKIRQKNKEEKVQSNVHLKML